MGKYPCIYTVKFWNCNDDISEQSGFIYADNFHHAVNILENYYGELEKLSVELYEDGLVELDKEELQIVKDILRRREEI